ncbi:MAG: helix-turn-helix transcriptional regulator [Oligoflexia bacterium]|nr:helix-turn-helix transcriptional regulator [Oligoflexia bacterium]
MQTLNEERKQFLNEERKQFLNEERKQFLREHFLRKNLSKSEVEVVILVLQGLINREVANRLCVAEKTIKFHLGNAYKKLNISRRSELIWTLPLADFVGAANKSQNNQEINSREDKRFDDGNEIIPSGISTVSDM